MAERHAPPVRPAAFTTAATHAHGSVRARPLVLAFFAAYAAVWAWAATDVVDRAEWALEQLLPAGLVAFLLLAWRRLQLSDTSYAAVAAFLMLHAAGARYGYDAAPAGAWLAREAGAARNPYDRVVHCAFGLLVAYPLRELWLRFYGPRHGGPGPRARGGASVVAVQSVLAGSALYEVLEWGAARLLAPGLGAAFVGAQGDVWDAPADMALAALGAVLGLAGAEAAHRARALRRARRVARWRRVPSGPARAGDAARVAVGAAVRSGDDTAHAPASRVYST